MFNFYLLSSNRKVCTKVDIGTGAKIIYTRNPSPYVHTNKYFSIYICAYKERNIQRG